MNAIYPTIPLDNRLNKRKFFRQALTIAPELQQIIDEFCLAIRVYPKAYSYKEIYEIYLEKWRTAVASAQKSMKDSVQIDVTFFSDNYKPQI